MSQRLRTTTTERETTGCPECDGDLRPDGAETVCADCGLVVEADAVDLGAEWRAFSTAEKRERSRVGPPTTVALHDNGLSTEIDFKDEDANGNRISGRKRAQLNRLRTWDQRSKTWDGTDRIQSEALGELDRMRCALGIDQGRHEQACQLFTTLHESGDGLVGRSMEAWAGACIYAVGRMNRDGLLLAEIAAVARVDEDRITNAYRGLNRDLELPAPPPRPAEYIPKLCSDLGMPASVRREAEELADAMDGSGLAPNGIAAACVYHAALKTGDRRTQVDVAEAAGVSEPTIRDRWKDLKEAIGDGA